eukprot:3779415-Prymnesium_polylepis.2
MVQHPSPHNLRAPQREDFAPEASGSKHGVGRFRTPRQLRRLPDMPGPPLAGISLSYRWTDCQQADQ